MYVSLLIRTEGTGDRLLDDYNEMELQIEDVEGEIE